MSTEPLKICKQCAKPIVGTARYKFCTQACMTAWHDAKKHTKATSPTATATGPRCAFCSSPMAPGAHTLGNYCSDMCKRKAAEDDEDAKTEAKVAKVQAKAAPELLHGTCKKCSKSFSTSTRPVRKYCTAACRKAAFDAGDFKHGPSPGFKAAPTAPVKPQPTTAPSPWHHRALAVAKTLPSRLRRGLAGVFKAAADKLS